MNETQRDEFLRRVAAYQDGGQSEEELAKFDRELRDDQEKRELFIEIQKRSAAIAELFREEAVAPDDPPSKPRASRMPNRWVVGAALTVAGCLALFFLLTPQSTKTPRDSATLTFAKQVHWRGTTPSSDIYLEHRVPYQLDAGAIRLRMDGGGIVSMAAPASFTVVDATTIELGSGKLAARLPDNDSKLLVRAGDLEIRDLGTAFGVTATEHGEVDLAVFDGSVAVRSTDGMPNASEETLVEGEAISTSGGSRDRQKVPFDSGLYQDIWPLTIGIDDASNIVDFVPPGPNVPLESLAHDNRLFLMPERLNQRMKKPITVDLVKPGQTWPTSRPVRHTIGRKKVVSSYLLIYKPENSQYRDLRALSGSISFQHPILGVAVEPAQLRKTDRIFGTSGIDYKSFAFRRLEDKTTEEGDLPADSLRISDDGRQLYFNLYVGAYSDHIRVLVDETGDHMTEPRIQRPKGQKESN